MRVELGDLATLKDLKRAAASELLGNQPDDLALVDVSLNKKVWQLLLCRMPMQTEKHSHAPFSIPTGPHCRG